MRRIYRRVNFKILCAQLRGCIHRKITCINVCYILFESFYIFYFCPISFCFDKSSMYVLRSSRYEHTTTGNYYFNLISLSHTIIIHILDVFPASNIFWIYVLGGAHYSRLFFLSLLHLNNRTGAPLPPSCFDI